MTGSSGNPYIDALTGVDFSGTIYSYSWLDFGFDNNITYAFGNIDGYGWTTEQMDAWRGAAQQWSNFANITFTEVPVGGNPELLESWVDSATMNSLTGGDWSGWHQWPRTDIPADGYYNIDRTWLSGSGNLEQGGFGFRLMMHEIGHGLGVFHPHDDILFPGVTSSSDLGDNDLNQNIYTLMSYNRGVLDPGVTNTYGHVGTPMALDIAAIQYLYGPNWNYQTGNDTYYLPDANQTGTFWSSIWDAGGNDTIEYFGSRDTTIDLRAATLQNEPGGGGFMSNADGIAGGFTIAYGVVIENAFGGSGSDTITGNAANNVLNSGAGNDTIFGGAGNDMLDGVAGADAMSGGTGNDIFYVDNAGDTTIENAGEGYDRVYVDGLASWTLSANVERLTFTDTGNHTGRGNAGNNRLEGNAGLDKFIIDAGGADIFSGGSGEDSFDGRSSATKLTVRLDNQALNADAVAGDTFASMEKFFGSNTAGDYMKTGAARAKFSGFGGNDTLIGGNSIDVLQGGAGDDALFGGAARDTLQGGTGNDTMNGGSAYDTFLFVEADFGQDTITDFLDGTDKLKVYSAVADELSDFTISGNGTSTVTMTLAADPANTITLNGSGGSNVTITDADVLFY